MPKSMTGYGISEFSIGEDRFSLELKSVNHRFIDINIKVPDRFFLLENKIRDAVKRSCARGCFYISITSAGETAGTVKANIPLARHYLGALQELKTSLGLKQEIDIALLLKFKDIFSSVETEHDFERDWEELRTGLEIAINSLIKMRAEEGAALAKDIVSRLDCMEDIASNMEVRAPVVAETYKEKLKQRMANVLGNASVDETRLLTEVAIFAERSNITEELVRLESHLMQLKDMLLNDEPVGRKMDFLCQEVLREINTIGSKANDFELANFVVSAKAELEKIREQVQNVE
ncbi:MAG: YicC family protein [Deltaproteobacteria bacterium]|nr:YicC family protein [Deltaproteobacteria bacterium]MBI3754710.1 YicC family protein [Deltaproteobacteria bacterium]